MQLLNLLLLAVRDSVQIGQVPPPPARSFDMYGVIWDYLTSTYFTNPVFLGQIVLVLGLIIIGRVFIFDNRKVPMSSANLLYPAIILVSCVISVIVAEVGQAAIKERPAFESGGKFWVDLVTSTVILFFCYGLFGHKIVAKVSKMVNYNYVKPEKKEPALANDPPKI